jgi:hypothetical protein
MKPNRIMFLLSSIFPLTMAAGLLLYVAWLVIRLRISAWIDKTI